MRCNDNYGNKRILYIRKAAVNNAAFSCPKKVILLWYNEFQFDVQKRKQKNLKIYKKGVDKTIRGVVD